MPRGGRRARGGRSRSRSRVAGEGRRGASSSSGSSVSAAPALFFFRLFLLFSWPSAPAPPLLVRLLPTIPAEKGCGGSCGLALALGVAPPRGPPRTRTAAASDRRRAVVARRLRRQGQGQEEEHLPEERQEEQRERDRVDQDRQWDLFVRHHASRAAWSGWWTTVGPMGDVLDETRARVVLEPIVAAAEGAGGAEGAQVRAVRHAHEFPDDRAAAADAGGEEAPLRVVEVATHSPGGLGRRAGIRLAGRGMAAGPRLSPSTGAVALELALRFRSHRLRAAVQVAPAWPRRRAGGEGEEDGGPPPAYKVARATLCRETLLGYYPTPQDEERIRASSEGGGGEGGPAPGVWFHRGVPPFAWHDREWSGTSWTWGPGAGDRGWSVRALEPGDRWHGAGPAGAWNWRDGCASLQFPQLMAAAAGPAEDGGDDDGGDGPTALFRMAWLADPHNLLRIEAGVVPPRPVWGEAGDGGGRALVGFEPPRLVSLRCDELRDDLGVPPGP